MQTDLFSKGPGQGPDAWSIELGGRTVHYLLTLSPKARKVWFKIGPDGTLEVVVPRKMPLRGLDDIIRQKSVWILKNVPDEAPGRHRSSVRFEHGAALPYLGTLYRLEVLNSASGEGSAGFDGERIVAHVPAPPRETDVRKAVVGWLKSEALRYIKARLSDLGKGFGYGRVTVKDQRTRWASCSASGNLSFNWRTVLAPPDVVDYLIIHELAHLERPDHSRAFWKKVELLCPDYRRQEAWLKNSGRALFSL
jgi:predicted metal-dependent hydrolase